jgi:hypothetical protein
LPDLVPLLPVRGQIAPVFVDRFQVKGRLLYRFDAVLENEGGALDMFRDPATGDVMQAIWAGGFPDSEPVDPNVAPSGPKVAIEDRSAMGALFRYDADEGHGHWHLASAAAYELLVPGATARLSAKVGFCLSDSYGPLAYFPYGWFGPSGANTFCAPGDPTSGFVRMGISAGSGDYYASQVADQWIDVTGLTPGAYKLRAVANPAGVIDESNANNNVVEQVRTIPGTSAATVSVIVAGRSARIRLAGAIVAPEIPGRRNATCAPSQADPVCYVSASRRGPLQFQLRRRPAHGTVVISARHGLRATAVYRPNQGYRGDDTFTYTVTDIRGLTSLPASVRVRVR